MTLKQCYLTDDGFFLLNERMARILAKTGLANLREALIRYFCLESEFSGLLVSDPEDYKRILEIFDHFVTGVRWAMELQPALQPS